MDGSKLVSGVSGGTFVVALFVEFSVVCDMGVVAVVVSCMIVDVVGMLCVIGM